MKIFRLRFIVFVAVFFHGHSAFAVPTMRDSALSVTEAASGLSVPTTMAFIGVDDILVLQKNDGRVRRVIGGVLQANPVLDVAVDSASERGLLGIALHPNFPATSQIYLYFTESGATDDTSGTVTPIANRVYRYTWNGSTLGSPTLILDLPVTPGPNHDGGILIFGPDGKLYIIIGDLNRNGQLQNNTSLGAPGPDDTSVILRLNPDGSVPSDNPFFSQGGNLAKYFAYGIRNSFGMAFDPMTSALWMTENGPGDYDEINLVRSGFNSGWNKIHGPDSRDTQNIGDLVQFPGSEYSDPKFSWLTTVGPTGIAFLNSTALGAPYQNDAFVGDINNGNLYRFNLNASRDGFVFSGAGLIDLVADNAGELDETIIGTGFNGISDVKVGPDGRLYVVSLGDGKIYAISSVAQPLSIGTTSLPQAEVGVSYDVSLNITGGTPPYAVSVTSGALPPGLTIVTGGISGTPTKTGNFRFTLRAADQSGMTATRSYRLSVRKARR